MYVKSKVYFLPELYLNTSHVPPMYLPHGSYKLNSLLLLTNKLGVLTQK